MYNNSLTQSALGDSSAAENWGLRPKSSPFKEKRVGRETATRGHPGPLAEQELRQLMLCIADRRGNAAQAFTTLYTQYAKRIFRFCLFHLRDAATAQELTHDVFLIVWKSAHTYQGHSSLKVWLYGVAYNLCRNARHRAVRPAGLTPREETGRTAERLGNAQPRLPTLSETLDVPSPGLEPEGQVAAHQRGALVQRLIARLPKAQQEVIHFTYVEGLSIHAIAQILGVSGGTVKSRMFAARRLLRHYMQEAGLTQEDL